ncbi:hypothetical protein [Pseudomonas aeruginosa]|uniref:hypothetical protein n=1 Tax=Pseudomonas aeruginosa TaxID=287 RepID=UPI00235892D8|nr:hypothetical protein [Pseudomonas aeruginosa]
MEESGIVGFTVTGAVEKVTDFRTAPFCSQAVFVEICTFHGPTRQRRWHRVHQGISRVECQRWVEELVAVFPTEEEARRSFGLTRERARQVYRIRGVRA